MESGDGNDGRCWIREVHHGNEEIERRTLAKRIGLILTVHAAGHEKGNIKMS